ncbi:MAG: UDP-N-acetylmuramoyl-L-alanyl-D-glutamate--2,6-diaminopimelate ligase [Rhodospirillaceae bacterium]|nr:MAG: UDP-N-acetylmuramoyl-L-alanyl-D-glutamate--2,6-diaminopimelate ligase [Rhodospirillaceae bacterium]
MRLSDLLRDEEMALMFATTGKNVEITGITADSRNVEPGFLFAALPGAQTDGARFVPQALRQGAVAILGAPALKTAFPDSGAEFLPAENARKAFAMIAAHFCGAQPRQIAAVTGTNGKSSVVGFARQIWEHLGVRAASLGTLGLEPPLASDTGAQASPLTTPDPVRLHKLLAELATQKIDHLAMEASSHGLEQFRLDGVRVSIAVFTTFSRDHLDYHGSLEAYLAAKLRLFSELLDENGTAVLNADDAAFDSVQAICVQRGVRIFSYGEKGDALRLLESRPVADGQDVACEILGKKTRFHLPLVGAFQAKNALAALGLVHAAGADMANALAILPKLRPIPGRMETIGRLANGAQIHVDYAHTPDALANALRALRPYAAGRLVVLFGCGGNRDRGKRPEMGAVADALADAVFVTDDNPRNEDASAIRQDILIASRKGKEIPDRRLAIHAAIESLGAGDVLLIAGKGHEQGQIVNAETLPFDDRDIARNAISATGDTPK